MGAGICYSKRVWHLNSIKDMAPGMIKYINVSQWYINLL